MKNNLFVKIFVMVVFIGSGSTHVHTMDTVEDLVCSRQLARDFSALWREDPAVAVRAQKEQEELDQKGKWAEALVEKTKREMAERQAAEEREREKRAKPAKTAKAQEDKLAVEKVPQAAIITNPNGEVEKIVIPTLQSPVKMTDSEKPQGWIEYCRENKGTIGVGVVVVGVVAARIYQQRNK